MEGSKHTTKQTKQCLIEIEHSTEELFCRLVNKEWTTPLNS